MNNLKINKIKKQKKKKEKKLINFIDAAKLRIKILEKQKRAGDMGEKDYDPMVGNDLRIIR